MVNRRTILVGSFSNSGLLFASSFMGNSKSKEEVPVEATATREETASSSPFIGGNTTATSGVLASAAAAAGRSSANVPPTLLHSADAEHEKVTENPQHLNQKQVNPQTLHPVQQVK